MTISNADMILALRALGYENVTSGQPLIGAREWYANGQAPRIPTDLSSILRRCRELGLFPKLAYLETERATRWDAIVGPLNMRCKGQDDNDPDVAVFLALADLQRRKDGGK